MPRVANPAAKQCAECGADITGRRGKTCAGECREIRARRQRREYAARRYREMHAARPWRKYLPEIRCLTCGDEIPKRPGVRTPTRCPVHQAAHTHAKRLEKERRRRFRRYGITEAIFDALFEAQGRACAICQSKTSGGVRGWHIDHDHRCCSGHHSCGACVRGLLCVRCNVLIGMADERPEVLNTAAEYVRRPHLK